MSSKDTLEEAFDRSEMTESKTATATSESAGHNLSIGSFRRQYYAKIWRSTFGSPEAWRQKLKELKQRASTSNMKEMSTAIHEDEPYSD